MKLSEAIERFIATHTMGRLRGDLLHLGSLDGHLQITLGEA